MDQVIGSTLAGEQVVREVRNDRAVAVYERVQKKLTGGIMTVLDLSGPLISFRT